MGFVLAMQDWFNIKKPNENHTITDYRRKKEIHDHLNAEKASDNIQYLFLIFLKTLSRLEIEGIF